MAAQIPPRLGWIGLGSMGLAMATNIQNHLNANTLEPLRYWNRTISRGDSLQVIRGVPSQTIEELVHSSDIIFISVSDDAALQSITTTILSSGPITSKIFIDTTTVHPHTTTAIAAHFTTASAAYLAAPVFGSTPVAVSGQLLMAVAGPIDAINAASPYIQSVLARSVINVGTEPAKALLLKTTSNFITAGLMYLLSEAHTLAEKSGLPADVLHTLVEQNFGAYAGGVSERLFSGAYCPAVGEAPRSGLELGIKDVGHGARLARHVGMELGVGEMYLKAAGEAKEWGDERGRKLDSSSVYGIVRKNAGLEFENEVVKKRVAEGQMKEV